MDATVSTVRRFYFLDSARGLAALSVSTWHFFTAFIYYRESVLINSSPLHMFWYGEADVVFFFIHSGFILSYSYTRDVQTIRPASYLRFLIERAFRIYPLFLFILLLSFLLQRWVFCPTSVQFISDHLQKFWRGHYSVSDLIKQAILIVQIPAEANLRLIPQDWTLSVELIVGAMIPFAALLLKKAKYLFWPVIFVAIILLHFSTYLVEFAAGIFFYYYFFCIALTW
jgi:peptidoglycan/LPS O-acetylase OafA/YrhL